MSCTKCTKTKTKLQLTFFQLVYNNLRKSSFAGMISFPFVCVFSLSVFFKGINSKFPEAVYNGFICCAKKIFYFICVTPQLDIFCHYFVKFLENNCHKSLHLMDIQGGNNAQPPLYLYKFICLVNISP